MSNMDALTDTADVVKQAIAWGHPAIAITDHGVAQSFPDAWHAGQGKDKILYGVEGYFVNNVDDRIAVHGQQDQDFPMRIVCFDIETTGLKVRQEAITEIGAVVLEHGEVRALPDLRGPRAPADAEDHRSDRHHRRDAGRCPQPKDALTAFLDFVDGRPLAAHNAEFDISFIREGCRTFGIPFEPTYLDTLILAQNLLPELTSSSWTSSAEHLHLPDFNHHRASDDAAMVGYMLVPFTQMLRERGRADPPADQRRPGEDCPPWARPIAMPKHSSCWRRTRSACGISTSSSLCPT